MFVSMRRSRPVHIAGLLLAACGGPADRPAGQAAEAPPAWLFARQAEQRGAATGSQSGPDFAFTDRVDSSGITFISRFVEDAGKTYKKVHYDHGTGLAGADVDGDGRPDLYFVSQLGTSELWRNLGGGRFANITDSAGLRMDDAIAVAAAFADIDNDGDPDLFVTTARHGNRLFENAGGGRFRNITDSAGVGYSGHSSGIVFFDYDRDGLLDLFVANVGRYTTDEQGPGGFYVGLPDAFHGHTFPERAEASLLYRNAGGNRFEDVTSASGLVDKSWSGEATVLDANDDGWPDLYLLNMQGADHLWLNQRGKRFADASRRYFPVTPWGAMGVKAFDWNGDGRIDLFVTDMHSDMFANIPPELWAAENMKADSGAMAEDYFPAGKAGFVFGNGLYTNLGNGRYEEVSDSAGVENYWPWGPSVDDLNADGWDDIFIASSMNYPHRYGINSVLLNERGKRFVRSEFILGVEPRAGGATRTPWFTAECGGADSLLLLCKACAQRGDAVEDCRVRDKAGRVTVMGSLGSRAALLVDLDGDGDLDIITNEFGSRPQVLVSDLSARQPIHWLSVQLQGSRSNRQGLGARVTVVLGDGRRLVKVMDGKSGYLSQSALPLYFGLGAVDAIARVEVAWPSGQRQVVASQGPSGRLLTVREP